MNGRVCVVTGATHGIGVATVHALAALGATVVIHGRDGARAEAVAAQVRRDTGNTQVRTVQADFAELAQVRRLAGQLAQQLPRLDVLINNAALMARAPARSADHYELTFAVNHLAPFLLTNLLLPKLRGSAPARVIIVASEAHRRAALDFDDLMNQRVAGLWPAYQRSKLANILFARELARRLAGCGVTVNALHPGVVNTNLFHDSPPWMRLALRGLGRLLRSPHQGADTSVYLASAPELAGRTGGYYHRRRLIDPSRAAQNAADAARLWQESARLTGVAA